VKQRARKERSITPENPDIEFTAEVRARELRFDEVPDTEVHPPAQTKRENLPEKVRPADVGTTFRNVSVQLRIANELTVSEPNQREELREGDTERFVHRHDSGKPSQEAGQKAEERPQRRESD
jgi:hypothetical protein